MGNTFSSLLPPASPANHTCARYIGTSNAFPGCNACLNEKIAEVESEALMRTLSYLRPEEYSLSNFKLQESSTWICDRMEMTHAQRSYTEEAIKKAVREYCLSDTLTIGHEKQQATSQSIELEMKPLNKAQSAAMTLSADGAAKYYPATGHLREYDVTRVDGHSKIRFEQDRFEKANLTNPLSMFVFAGVKSKRSPSPERIDVRQRVCVVGAPQSIISSRGIIPSIETEETGYAEPLQFIVGEEEEEDGDDEETVYEEHPTGTKVGTAC